jgi:hypothetical protein
LSRKKKGKIMNLLIQLKQTTSVILIAAVLACLAFSPSMQALLPPPAPDGGYPNANTAEGNGALLHLTSGTQNTAAGYFALYGDETGSYNTATGALALSHTTTGSSNTAIGDAALDINVNGNNNTAIGASALEANTANGNTAVGRNALIGNTNGHNNTALGGYGQRSSLLAQTGDLSLQERDRSKSITCLRLHR